MKVFGYNIIWPFQRAKKKTLLHPEVKELMEYAFTLTHQGIKHDYYKFIDPTNMPYRRYQALMKFKDDVDRGLTQQEIKTITKLIKDCINNPDGIQITSILKAVELLDYSSEMLLDMSIMEKIMTCYFIDMSLNEDVTDYNEEFNEKKAEIFRSQPPDSFFFLKPVKQLMPLSDPSEDDLKVFLTQTQAKQILMEAVCDQLRGPGMPKESKA